MRDRDCGDFWCPFGRTSIQSMGTAQTPNEPPVKIVPGGAFNRVFLNAPGAQGGGEWHYPTRCLGEGCACWRHGLFSWLLPSALRYGSCGLAFRTLPFFWMLVAVLMAAVFFGMKNAG